MQSYMHFAERTGVSDTPQATVVVLDNSSSMDATDLSPTRLAAAGEAGCQLIEQKMKRYPHDLVGVVTFSTDAEVVFPLQPVETHGRTQQHALRRLTAGRATNVAAGLEAAYRLLRGKASGSAGSTATSLGSSIRALTRWLYDEDKDGPDSSDETRPAILPAQIILLSDGMVTAGKSPLLMAEKLKQSPLQACIEVIGIAGSHSADHLDEPTLKQIASQDAKGAPRYYLINDTESLVTKFRELSGHITRI